MKTYVEVIDKLIGNLMDSQDRSEAILLRGPRGIGKPMLASQTLPGHIVKGAAAYASFNKLSVKNLLVIILFLFGDALKAQTTNTFLTPTNLPPLLELAWIGIPDPSVTNYFLYEGTNSLQYTVKLPASTNTSIIVSNLTRGVTYYFNLTAQNNAGLEGAFAGEVNYKPPAPPAAPTFKPIIILTAQTSPSVVNPIWTDISESQIPLLAVQQTGFYRVKIAGLTH